MYQVKSAVLFLIFNRPKETELVFQAIKMARPSKLYIAADGPRVNNVKDVENCSKVRGMVKLIDWPCEYQLLFREGNLGCGLAVREAITWFFDNESEGIILEDDCLPNTDFFRFCDLMLEKYRDDSRIGHISGTNMHDNIKRGNASYFFSRLTGIWGWASWARVWKDYDYDLSKLDEAIGENFMDDITVNKRLQKSLINDFLQTRQRKVDTWDYQYLFAHFISNRLSVFPNANLISNIGYNSGGTHTVSSYSQYSEAKTKALDVELSHPTIFLPNKEADNYTLEEAIPTRLRAYYKRLKYMMIK